MESGDVKPPQLVEAATSPLAEGDGRAGSSFRPIGRSTLYGYLKVSDDPVGNGDWDVIDNVLRCIARLAKDNDRPVHIDYDSWQRDWQRLMDRRGTRRSRITPDNWIGGWDGAADAVLTHSSAQEFTLWPPGQSRLDSLSQAVADLSAAYEPQLAKETSQRLVDGAVSEFGEIDPKTLAARHALAFWTGQTGEVELALKRTSHLRADCRAHLGDGHILSRLAALREALWTSCTGRWHEANRRYIDTARAEADHPDRDPSIWLLARWGMARTGGRTGNWLHAYAELHDLLPSVTETFGPDHPATLDAGNAHAWAAGHAGKYKEARSRLELLADRAETVLGIGHPTSLRLRTSLAYWTLQSGSHAQSLPMASAVRERCQSLLGPEHPISIHATEAEALCLLESDKEAALTALSDVLVRTKRCFGRRHPQTLQAASNHAAVRAVVEGPDSVLEVFEKLADQMRRFMGDEHPDTLRVRMNLVIATLDTQGAWAARRLCKRTVGSLRKVLGDDHPETVAGTDLLEIIEGRTGDRPENSPQPDLDYSYVTASLGGHLTGSGAPPNLSSLA
jgi:hypothetical protein